MASTNQVKELPPLPDLLTSNHDFTMDYGGSVMKFLYKKKSSSGEERLYMRSISGGDYDTLTEFISDLPAQDGRQVIVTGLGCKKFSTQLQKIMNVKFNVVPELQCFTKGFRLLTSHLKYTDIFSEIPQNAFLKALRITRGFAEMVKSMENNTDTSSVKFLINENESDKTHLNAIEQNDDDLISSYHTDCKRDLSNLYPCIIVNCGSGFPAYKLVNKDTPALLVGFSPRGGRTFLGLGSLLTGAQLVGQDIPALQIGFSPRGGRTLLGLGSLLTGAQTFDELVSMAANGNGENVDQYIKSLKGGDADDFYNKFPDEALSFCFGHAFKKDIESFPKEDLAASIVNLICNDLAQSSVTFALRSECKHVVFCGSILNHHAVVSSLWLNFLSNSLGYPSAVQPRMHVCTFGSYLGTIGAWTIAAKAETKKEVQKK